MTLISSKLEEAVAKATSLEAGLATLATERDGLKASLEQVQASVAALTADRDAVKASLEKALADGVALVEGLKADHAKVAEALTAERDAMKADLDKARVALSNPAFADASAKGHAGAIPAGVAVEGQADRKNLEAELAKITDPAKKVSFFRQHFGKGK